MMFGRRKNKYGAKPADGFGSKLEAAVYQKLKDREVLGLISDIKRQQQIILQGGPRVTRITIRIDFTFIDNATSETVAAEAKGFSTRDFVLKLKLWRAKPPMKLELWKGDYRRPKLVEVIEPKTTEGEIK